MEIAAKIIGIILLVLWVFLIPVTKRAFRINGKITQPSVFQFNILPFIAGVALVLSGKLMVLIAVPILWVLAIPFYGFFLYIFPLIMGWVFGTMFLSEALPHSRSWYYGSGVLGVLAMFVVCTVVLAVIGVPSE